MYRDSLDDTRAESKRWRGWLLLPIAGVVAVAVWFAGPRVREQGRIVAELPALRQTVAATSGRLDQAEASVRAWLADREELQRKLESVQVAMDVRLREARKQAREAGDQWYRRVKAESESRSEGLERRLASLESAREPETLRLARMQGELTRISKQLDQQEARLAAAEGNAYDDKQMLEQKAAGLEERIDRGRGDVTRLARRLETNRVSFELSRGRSRQLVPGVSVCVTGTNVARRQVNGWMWILPDRKTIWLRDQNTMTPVAWYAGNDGKRREIVFTNVTTGSAVGYLLLPAAGS